MVSYGLGMSHHDKEGRLLTIEFMDYFLVNVYTPNSKRGLLRLDYRTQQWDPDFFTYIKMLEKNKPVVVCGDLNVAHKEIDLANPRQNRRNAGFTYEERASMDRVIEAGFIDTFREFEKGPGHYSWWSYIGRAREKNVGWRIDYFLISPELRPRLQNAFILPEVTGSDHCPVGIILD
jgi:exodeoxyribonuclease-3